MTRLRILIAVKFYNIICFLRNLIANFSVIESCDIGEKEIRIRTATAAEYSATTKFSAAAAAAEFPAAAAELSAASYSKSTAPATKSYSTGRILGLGRISSRLSMPDIREITRNNRILR